MADRLLNQKESPDAPTLDAGFEAKLLASQLVSEVRKSPGHYSFTKDYPDLFFGLLFDILALLTATISVFFKMNKNNENKA